MRAGPEHLPRSLLFFEDPAGLLRLEIPCCMRLRRETKPEHPVQHSQPLAPSAAAAAAVVAIDQPPINARSMPQGRESPIRNSLTRPDCLRSAAGGRGGA